MFESRTKFIDYFTITESVVLNLTQKNPFSTSHVLNFLYLNQGTLTRDFNYHNKDKPSVSLIPSYLIPRILRYQLPSYTKGWVQTQVSVF